MEKQFLVAISQKNFTLTENKRNEEYSSACFSFQLFKVKVREESRTKFDLRRDSEV